MPFTRLSPSTAHRLPIFPQALKPETDNSPPNRAERPAEATRAPLDQLAQLLTRTIAHGNTRTLSPGSNFPWLESGGEIPESPLPGDQAPGVAPLSEDQRAVQESLRQLEIQADNARKLRELRRLEIRDDDRSVLRRLIFVDIFAKHRPRREVRSGGPCAQDFAGCGQLESLSSSENNRLAAAFAADQEDAENEAVSGF